MIIVFGSINIDMVMPVEHFPMTGETVMSEDYISRPGGKGANQAVAAARQEVKTAMVGKVGDDAFGRRSLHNLKMHSILAAGVAKSERPTGCATIWVNPEGLNMVVSSGGANLDVMADQVPDEILSEKNILLTDMELDPEQTWTLLARAKSRGTKTILNAAPAGFIPDEVFGHLDYVILNEIEIKQIGKACGLKGDDVEKLAHDFAQKGNLTCIVTLGQNGSIAVNSQGEKWKMGALLLDVVDTTGAGDAFCGIFAASLERGLSFTEAWHRAAVGGSVACMGLGAQEGIPYKEALIERLEEIDPPQQIS